MINQPRTPQQAMADAIKSGAVQAFVDGKKIQYSGLSTPSNWTDLPHDRPNFCGQSIIWRPAPTPRLRPWKPEEVPLDAWFKGKNEIAFRLCFADLIQSTTHPTVASANGGHVTLDLVFKEWKHSIDGGKTWHPCGVQEGGE